VVVVLCAMAGAQPRAVRATMAARMGVRMS
jgi:hypothetical protein